MKSFIAAVPIFDADMRVEAYRMNTQNGNKFFGMANDYTAMNDAMNSIGMEILSRIGVEPFTGGKPIFVDCNEFHIVTGLPRRCGVSPELLVCVIPKNTQADHMVVRQCQALKNAGYSIALNNIPFGHDSRWLYILADYVLIDSQSPNASKAIYNARLSNRRQKIVLTGIPNQAAFERQKSVPFCLFEGNFHSAPVTRGSKEISPLKLNALRLLKIVGEDDFDLSEASNVISRDPALTISLLRLINSSSVGISRKINDIKSAVAILGQREVKKWVIVSISTQLAEDKPNEITKLSLVRAKFAENLATAFSLGVFAPSLFLVGLFSLLDIILDKPMEKAIAEISVNEKIRAALVDNQGELYEVLRLVCAYERADWESVSITMIRKDIGVEEITKAFLDALIWYKGLLKNDDVAEDTSVQRLQA